MKINQIDLFSTPIFEVPVPEMAKHNDAILKLFDGQIASGALKQDEYGHGYQTLPNLFTPGAYGPDHGYFIDVLGNAFCDACEEILYQQRNDTIAEMVWVNSLTFGWAYIQTAEQLGKEPPWHTHLPAQLSGCYYASTSTVDAEGTLQFFSPTMDSIFQPQTIEVVPKAGHMIIFPSWLKHRPTPSPSTKKTRISLCMDSHWTVQMSHQVPPEMMKQIPAGSEYGKFENRKKQKPR